MKQNEIIIPGSYVSGLHINGMRGRVLKLPAKKPKTSDREILLVYGHHSSIERMYSIALYLSEFGNITMPDLPGFGGMDSFYKIGSSPTLDNMADYLATFIKLQYKKKPITICGMSYGFLVVTKMLQKYPYMQKQINMNISLVGFSKKNDFSLKRRTIKLFNIASTLASTAPVAFFVKNFILIRPFIVMTYKINSKKHVKLKDASKEEQKRRINFEVYLWKCNDARTYFATTKCFLNVDLTAQRISLPLYHVGVKHDQYFDKRMVSTNLKSIYDKLIVFNTNLSSHAPTVISDEKQAGKLIPTRLKKILNKSP